MNAMRRFFSIFISTASVLAACTAAQAATPSLPEAFPPAGTLEIGGISWDLVPAEAVRPEEAPEDGLLLKSFDTPAAASHVAFLHTFEPAGALHNWRVQVALAHRQLQNPPPPPTVFRYRVVYEDGSAIDIPVRFTESIDQWYRVHAVPPMLWAESHYAQDLNRASGEMAVAYQMEWPNPRPDRAIAEVRWLPNEDGFRDYGQATVYGVQALERDSTGRLLFVDRKPVGSDENPGTFDQPFGTLNHAARVAEAGDTVFVRGGLYALDEPVEVLNDGREEAWITITAFPGETPVFDAYGIHQGNREGSLSFDDGAIRLHNAPKYVRLQGLQVQHSRFAGISAYGDRDGQGEHVDIRFNTTYFTAAMGIIAHHIDHIRVNGNRVCRPHSVRMVTDPATGEPASHDHLAQEGIDLSRNQYFEIAYNEVYGGGKEAIDCISVSDGHIHHNYVHSSLNGIYIDSWSVPIERLQIDHNFIHDAYSGVPLATEGSNALLDFRIHHNIIVDSKSGGIEVTEATYKADPSPVQRIRVFNNTVHHAGYHADRINWFSTGIRVSGFDQNAEFRDVYVFNNIVTDSAHLPMSTSFSDPEAHDIRFFNNLLFPAESRLPERFKTLDSFPKYRMVLGANAVTEDPLYRDPARGDFRLRPGSPAIGAGVGTLPDGEQDAVSSDLGALSAEAAWIPGLDWAGRVTAFYYGERRYEPVDIPRDRYTIHRNHVQRPSWFQINRYGVDFQQLPAGEQAFGGITWFIEADDFNSGPTVLALEGLGSESKAVSIEGIPVGRTAVSLAFLQAFHPGPGLPSESGTELFRYVVHYADGSEAVIPVEWKVHIDHWLSERLEHLPEADLAWTLDVQKKRNRSSNIRLFAYEWENPKPEVAIESIDLVRTAAEDAGAPAVFAISTGHEG